MCSVNKVLEKIKQNSPENTYAEVSAIKNCNFIEKWRCFPEFYKVFNNIYFVECLQTAASELARQ